MIALALAAIVAAASPTPAASPAPTTSPAQTVYLSYNMPTRGYQSHTTGKIGNGDVTVDQHVDAYNNREGDVSLSVGREGFSAHYLIMDGIIYQRSGKTWTIPSPVPAVQIALLLFGTYQPSSTFDQPGRSVTNQGTGACGTATCDLYLASWPGKVNEKPIVTVSHLAIDPASRLLVSNDSTSFDAAGSQSAQFSATFGGFDGQQLSIPSLTIPTSMPDDCDKGDSSAGSVQLCLRHCTCLSTVIYSLTIGDTLVLRADGEIASTKAVTSPVMDNVTLQCKKTMVARDVDPKLAEQLKASGMSDAQIQTNLGQRQTASDCTVAIGGQTALTAHYDFKN